MWCLPRAGPGRRTVNEQGSAPSDSQPCACYWVSRRAEQGALCLGEAGRWTAGQAGKEGCAPVQGDGEVQEGGHQLGGVVPGQKGDGLQGIFPGLGDADGAELQVDSLAQAGNLCREEEYGERAGLGRGPGPAPGSLNGEGGAAPVGVEPLQVAALLRGKHSPALGALRGRSDREAFLCPGHESEGDPRADRGTSNICTVFGVVQVCLNIARSLKAQTHPGARASSPCLGVGGTGCLSYVQMTSCPGHRFGTCCSDVWQAPPLPLSGLIIHPFMPGSKSIPLRHQSSSIWRSPQGPALPLLISLESDSELWRVWAAPSSPHSHPIPAPSAHVCPRPREPWDTWEGHSVLHSLAHWNPSGGGLGLPLRPKLGDAAWAPSP